MSNYEIRNLLRFREGDDVIFVNPETRQWYFTNGNGERIYDMAMLEGVSRASIQSDYTEEEVIAFLDDLIDTLSRTQEHTVPLRGCSVYVTDACNMRCVHCRFSCGRADSKLSMDDIESYLSDEYRLGSHAMTVTGGEPLMVWKTTHATLKYAHDLGYRTNLLTNGSMVTEEIAQTLAQWGTFVQVSLDSVDPVVFDSFRNYEIEPVMRGIDLLISAGVQVDLSCSLSNKTIDDVDDIIEFGIERGIHGIHFTLLERGGRAEGDWSDLVVPDQRLIDFFGRLIHRYFNDGLREEILIAEFETMVDQVVHPPAVDHCNLMMGTSSLYEDGRVYACTNLCGDGRFDLGAPGEGDAIVTLQSIRHAELPMVQDISECSVCSVRWVCLGGCRDRVMLSNDGEMQHPDPYCKVFKFLYGRLLFEAARLVEKG